MYLSVNRMASMHGIPRDYLRKRVKQGLVPGFYSGSAFRIDETAFLEMLAQECREAVRGVEAEK